MNRNDVYNKVQAALRNGGLVRPDFCARCRAVPGKAIDGRSMIQAHHHDYSKPLEVEWICTACHRKETPLPAKMGAPNFGSKNGFSKLDEAKVLVAKQLREQGFTFQKIADRYGVDKSTARRAIKGQLWKHVTTSVAAAPQPKEPK